MPIVKCQVFSCFFMFFVVCSCILARAVFVAQKQLFVGYVALFRVLLTFRATGAFCTITVILLLERHCAKYLILDRNVIFLHFFLDFHLHLWHIIACSSPMRKTMAGEDIGISQNNECVFLWILQGAPSAPPPKDHKV